MPLLNLIVSKATDVAMSSNRGLSNFTSTTLSQAGTSLGDIRKDALTAGLTSANNSGIDESSLILPLTNMKDTALANNPGASGLINSAFNSALNQLPATFNSLLPSLANTSLYDIQKASKDSMSKAISTMTAGLGNFNPTDISNLKNIGLQSLATSGRTSDSLASTAFSAANKLVSNAVSSISSKISGIVQAKNLLSKKPDTSLPIDNPVQSAPDKATSGQGTTTVATDPIPEQHNYTDVITEEVKVYIEGVQIPYESYHVSQAIGQLPTASIQIPPQANLLDIARYYQPKIHIFYVDRNTGGDRLLFWGHIIAANLAMSKQQGYCTVSFECVHKNALLQQLTMEWSAGGASHAESGQNFTDTNPDQAAVQLHNFNSDLTIVLALQGITGLQKDAKDIIRPYNTDVINADATKLDVRFQSLEKRLVGMPASILNMWNQIKKEVFSNEKLNLVFSKVYLPLIEDGIGFFDRMSGHNFLEDQIQRDKKDHCNDYAKPEASKYPTMVPPAFRMDTLTAVQTQMTVRSLASVLGFSGEFVNFYDLFLNFYYGVEYELLTLASPAEVPVDPAFTGNTDDPTVWRSSERMAIETLIKPQLPFYYAPVCNVLLPQMYHTLNISQNEMDIPTRVTVVSTAASQTTNSAMALGVNYRAPHSIRESVAIGKEMIENGATKTSGTTLRDTTGSSYNVPGKYELGRGIRQKKLMMPQWLSHFTASSNATRAGKDDEVFPLPGTLEAKRLSDLKASWTDRYGYSAGNTGSDVVGTPYRESLKDGLNPYSENSGIMAYERLLFSAADYEYTKDVVRSKTGNVETIFNPYIVPGYPMDIIAKSPNLPSFHAMCASVVHAGNGSGINTSVSFMAAMTYTELSNYFVQPLHPWLQTALKMVNVAKKEGPPLPTGKVDLGLPASALTSKIEGVLSDAKNKALNYGSDVFKKTSARYSSDYGLTPDPVYDTNNGQVESIKQTIINNPRAKAVADQFYKSVFGVGAAEPFDIYDFETGTPKPVDRINGVWGPGSTGHNPLPNGGEGNDNLTAVGNLRLVGRQIESKKGIEDKFGIKFIELTPNNYSGQPALYENKILSNKDLLEPGASIFLDYEEVQDFINK